MCPVKHSSYHLQEAGKIKAVSAATVYWEIGGLLDSEIGGQYTYLLVTNLRSGLASKPWFNRAQLPTHIDASVCS